MYKNVLALIVAFSAAGAVSSADAATISAQQPLPPGVTTRMNYWLSDFSGQQDRWLDESMSMLCNYKQEEIIFFAVDTRLPFSASISAAQTINTDRFYVGCSDLATSQVDLGRIYRIQCAKPDSRVWQFQWRGRTPDTFWFKNYVCSPHKPAQRRWVDQHKRGIADGAPDMGAPDAAE